MSNPVKKVRNLIGDIMEAMLDCSRNGLEAEAYLEFTGKLEYGLDDGGSVSIPVIPEVLPEYHIGRSKDQESDYKVAIKIMVK